ncbi:MAG: chemotaxis protein CheB [Acidobacteria bacterium]|nr:MAG: chemotaxis protein CheB [Acidobacteriota bacterium]
MVVIGASAGGVDALMTLVRELPPDFPAPICIVLHIPPDSPSLLAHILRREGALPAKEAVDGEFYRNGTIYVAPPDKHLLVAREGKLRTVRGPRENRHRPAVDVLFRSAAAVLGPNVIGVILTGALDDGTAGLLAIKKLKGIAVVQDPSDALYPAMPSSAVAHVRADYVLPLSGIARQLTLTVNEPRHVNPAPPPDRDMLLEVSMAELDPDAMQEDQRPGAPSPYSCPDCGGVLWEIADGEYTRYRCRVGHAFSPETMLGAQSEVLEEALWTAAKTLEESARLSHRLAKTERTRGHDWLAKRFEEKEREARDRVEVIRRSLLKSDTSEVPIEISNATSR